MQTKTESLNARVATLVVFVGVMWLVRAIDSFRHVSILGEGIVPRSTGSLAGIFLAPFIHVSWSHLIANTTVILIWGSLVLLRGVKDFLLVIFISAIVAGVGIWFFGAPNSAHVGASGVALGLLGYLMFRGIFDRSFVSLMISAVVAIAYATSLASSLIPTGGISWSGHFFGFLGGILAARARV